MSQESSEAVLMKTVAALAMIATVWWLVKKLWLVKEGTEAEPPASIPAPRRAPGRDSAEVDPVDEAIDESFPASDPPSYAGARGQEGITT